MDKLNQYRDVVRKLVEEYASHKPSHGQIDSYPVIDSERDHYLAVQAGWDRRQRIQGAFLHIDIINGKVWIQFNGTDQPIAEELVLAGIPKEDIVLAEKPADIRPFTGYGVG
ncbi:MAG: XisI protein [Gemmataceae bacterium]